MDDPRTLAVLSMAASLIASGAPQYAARSVGAVAAELMNVANSVEHDLLGCDCAENPEGTVH